MRIRTVTLTGADDGVDPSDLLSLSLKYPLGQFGQPVQTFGPADKRDAPLAQLDRARAF
jgi:hypothetical protein